MTTKTRRNPILQTEIQIECTSINSGHGPEWTIGRPRGTLEPSMHPGRQRRPVRRQHLVFIGDLQGYSVREVCLGAAEYAAERPDLDLDPWPVVSGLKQARRSDLSEADCVIAPETDIRRLFGSRRFLKIPYVNVLDHRENVPSVELDDFAVGQMAAEHLLSRGYTEFAFVGVTDWPWSRLRGDSFIAALKARGIVAPRYEFPTKLLPINWAWKSERRRARLAAVLAELPEPCGIFAANDVIACFLVETARQQRLRVPEQIGVVGVDDDPVPTAAAGIAISSIVVPYREMGRRAAALIDRLRHDPQAYDRVRLPPTHVIVRTSTNAFMVDDRIVRSAQTYIESNRNRRIKVAEIAHAVGCTRATLAQRFRRHLGTGVLDYILSRRMEHAKDLLRIGESNVDQVAQICGFESTSFFCAVFKRITGTSPGRIRLAARSKPIRDT